MKLHSPQTPRPSSCAPCSRAAKQHEPKPPSKSTAATHETTPAAAGRATAASGSTNEGSGSSSSSASGNTSSSSHQGRDGRSYSSDRNKSDPFSSRRPPPIEEDFEAVGSKRGVPFEEARQAYKDAARKHHPDAGGDSEVMKRINAAWDRIRRSYGR